jgi:CRP-like cAMP-binding protein
MENTMNVKALEQYRRILANSVVFSHLSPAELDLIILSCKLVDVNEGEALLTEGRRGEGLYVILEGNVEFFLPERPATGVERPSRVRLNILGPGRCFGEYGVIDDRVSSASAQMLKAGRLCVLATAAFRRIVDENDRIGKVVYANLLRFLVNRLRTKDKELDVIVISDESGKA